MGIQFGDIDANQILENEFRINVLERIFDKLLQKNQFKIEGLTQEEVESIRSNVAESLKEKYPNAGIEYKRK